MVLKDKINFGIWFAEIRIKAGFESQRQLSLASGVANSTIARIEGGQIKPSQETLEKLAPWLGISRKDLMIKAGHWPDNHELGEIGLQEAVGKYGISALSGLVLAEKEDHIPEKKIEDAITDDPELLGFWKELAGREDLQLLFKQVKDLSPKSIKKIIKIIKAIEDTEAIED